MPAAATTADTTSDHMAPRAARKRPAVPLLGATWPEAARRLALVRGKHPVPAYEVGDVGERYAYAYACETARRQGFTRSGGTVVIAAAMPDTVRRRRHHELVGDRDGVTATVRIRRTR